MANLAAALSIVYSGSKLSLGLYRTAATTTPDVAAEVGRVAKATSDFSFVIKQLFAVVKEDDNFPSTEAFREIESIVEQGKAAFDEIKNLVPVKRKKSGDRNAHPSLGQYGSFKPSPRTIERLSYLVLHLNALTDTLSVLLQALFTAQSIIWARTRPAISPQKSAKAVANEETQLETLIVEQHMSILTASRTYNDSNSHLGNADLRLLMENDSSMSLAVKSEGSGLTSSTLLQYQEPSLPLPDPSYSDAEWLSKVMRVSPLYAEQLLQRWTRLREMQASLDDAERRVQAEKRETLQPTVESDEGEDEDETLSPPRRRSPYLDDAREIPERPPTVKPVSPRLDIDSGFGPKAPLSPAPSPRSSGDFVERSAQGSGPSQPPQPPRRRVTPPLLPILPTLPVEAAAAVEAKDEDEDLELEIPWKLCTRKNAWSFIDGKMLKNSSGLPPSEAYQDRNSWTEIAASWVCKEAIDEMDLPYTRVQKEIQDGRRTKFEPYFCIQRPLKYDQVRHLVERTVDIYRQARSPSPRSPSPPPTRKQRPTPNPPRRHPNQPQFDRDKTPRARQHPPLERSSTSYQYPPPPPPLDRSNSLPGAVPTYAPYPNMDPRASSTFLPMPAPYNPQIFAQRPPLGTVPGVQYPPPPTNEQYRTPPPTNQSYTPRPGATYPQSNLQPPSYEQRRPLSTNGYQQASIPQSPLRQSLSHSQARDRYTPAISSSDSTTEDSDNTTRSRRRRSRSRRGSHSTHRGDSKKKKKPGYSSFGTLAKVGGLAALLDGIVEMGVL